MRLRLLLLGLLFATTARGALLIEEGFEGPNDWDYWDGNSWEVITNFVGSGFDNPYSDNKALLYKETSGCRSGSQCLKMYGEVSAGLAEFWTDPLPAGTTELWVTYWEKVSSTYDFNFGHKHWLAQLEMKGDDPYLSWQGWDGPTNLTFASRVYSSGPIACSDATFAPTKSIVLPSQTWYQYKIHLKLNTVGSSNGTWKVWVKTDGTNWASVWDLDNIEIQCNVARDIDGLRFGGTRENSVTTPSFGTKWMDDIKIGTTEADVDSESADTTAPSTTITTDDPSEITEDSLTVVGTASDAVGVSGCKWRLSSAPDADNGTGCTGTTSFSCATSGYSEGSNTLYVGCYDAAGNYGSDSIAVNYTIPSDPPVLSNIAPASGARLALGSTAATLEVDTDVSATCRFGYRPGIAWGSLTAYGTTGGTEHSHSLAVVTGGVYQICTRCEASGMYSADSCASWSVAPDPQEAPW